MAGENCSRWAFWSSLVSPVSLAIEYFEIMCVKQESIVSSIYHYRSPPPVRFFSEVCLCKGHDRADPFLHRRQRDAPEVKKIEFRLPLEKISEVYKRGVDKY